jgi:hypothetical protein
LCRCPGADLQGGPGGLWPTLRLGEKLFRVIFSAHRRTPAPTGAVKLLLPTASRAPCHPAPCSCSAASHLAPVDRRRPPLGCLGAFLAPAIACRPPTSATRPTPPLASRAAMSGCRPQPPAHPALQALWRSGGLASLLSAAVRPPSLPARRGGPTSLLGSARRCLRPPSLPARRSGASLPPWPLPPWLPGRCAAVPGAGHPALRASGTSLLDRLHFSPGSSALCDCADLSGIVFAS